MLSLPLSLFFPLHPCPSLAVDCSQARGRDELRSSDTGYVDSVSGQDHAVQRRDPSPPPPPPTGRDFSLAGGLENAFRSRDSSPARQSGPPTLVLPGGTGGKGADALIPSAQHVPSSSFVPAASVAAPQVQRRDPLIPPMPPAADYQKEQVLFMDPAQQARGSAGAPATGPELESAPPTERNDYDPPYTIGDPGSESYQPPFSGARAQNVAHVCALLGGKARIAEPMGMVHGVLGPGQVEAWLERRKVSGSGSDASRGGGGQQGQQQGRQWQDGGRGGGSGGGGGGVTEAKAMPAGIGISLSPIHSGGMLVANLVPGGPAALTGKVLMGDELLAVDGRLIAGSSIPDVIRLVLGPSGTQVMSSLALTVSHDWVVTLPRGSGGRGAPDSFFAWM